MRYVPSSLFRGFCVSAVLAIAAGCSGGGESDDDTDDAAITAEAANKSQHSLKSHVLVGVAPSPENAKELGIAKWDVFAGTDAKSGFIGSVFYASDADGDVKYAFSVDVKEQAIAFAKVNKDGTPTGEKIDVAIATKLQSEVDRLRAMAQAATGTKSGIGTRSLDDPCAAALAWGALSVVTTVGVAAALGAVVYVGIWAGLAIETTIAPILGGIPGVMGGLMAWGAVAVGYVTIAYTLVKTPFVNTAQEFDACFRYR